MACAHPFLTFGMALISLSEWIDRYGDGADLLPGAVPRPMAFRVEPAARDGAAFVAWQRVRPAGTPGPHRFARRPFIRWMLGIGPHRSSMPAQPQGRADSVR